MATITKRGETFRIKVSLGYDANCKQIVKSTTFTPPTGVTPKKAEKLASEYAYEYERHCKGYAQLNENMRFSELAEWYFENYAPRGAERGNAIQLQKRLQKSYCACVRKREGQGYKHSEAHAVCTVPESKARNGTQDLHCCTEHIPQGSRVRIHQRYSVQERYSPEE